MNQTVVARSALLEVSVLAAYGVSRGGSFRQRDIRYFVDLFANWIDTAGQADSLFDIHNTQIARFVNGLVTREIARLTKEAGRKRYSLQVGELPGFVRILLGRSYIQYPPIALFLYLFLNDYFVPFIQQQLENTPRRYHSMLKRLSDIANPGIFLEGQLFFLDERLREFERVFSMHQETDALLAESDSTFDADMLLEDSDSPAAYILHSEIPLKKLLSRGGYDRITWEASRGRHRRLEILWRNEVARLQLFRKQMEDIR